MITAPLPQSEDKRLEVLRRYDVLDTEAEKDYDDLTKLISEICDVPISLVSLVDESRQWFKSRQGLGASETPRDLAFCAHAILEDDLFVVEDSRQDERFRDNPLVTGQPNVIFYAGMPLTSPEGENIGTFCVIDNKPRQLSEHQLFALETLSKQVVKQLELNLKLKQAEKTNKQLAKTNQKMSSSINYGKRIQRAVMPSIHSVREHLPESFLFMKPKDVVSGDFYYFAKDKATDKIIIAVLDCTGHGVQGAFMSMIANEQLNKIVKVKNVSSPEDILKQLRAGMMDSLHSERMDSYGIDGLEIGIAVIDQASSTVEFSGARVDLIYAHPEEVGNLGIAKASRNGIGSVYALMPEKPFGSETIHYRPDTVFYFYTDGVVDQFGGKDFKGQGERKFSKRRLHNLIQDICPLPLKVQHDTVIETFSDWMGSSSQTDDMLIFAFKP